MSFSVIRKILFLIVLFYTIAWFAIASTFKNNMTTLINNTESDNIKISYDAIKVSGYPIAWEIRVLEPKVQIIDHVNVREISTKELCFLVDFNFKKATIDLGKTLKHQEIARDKNDKNAKEYSLHSHHNISGTIKFDKALYDLSTENSFKEVTEWIIINNKLLSVSSQDKEIFNIENLDFSFNKIPSLVKEDNQEEVPENCALKLNFAYNSVNDSLNFKKATFDLATNFNLVGTTGKNKNTPQNISIDRLILACDENAKLDLTGKLQFIAKKLPIGQLSLELTNYQNVIDKLIPDSSLLPKKMINLLVERAINSSVSENGLDKDVSEINSENIKFDIIFSDDGIKIGSVNLSKSK